MELSGEDARAALRVEVVAVVRSDQETSWDVTLHSLANSEPIAHDVVNLHGQGLSVITEYVDVMIARVGLRRATELAPTRPSGRLAARLEQSA
ncbi:hypothetical protein [Agromyces sp. LHK192]|uniref:hypothetical protein n=1 Tax=Agromyces sp. LHK192 TaxID=2498704 RepID=UPI000FDA14AA|nr:hypothetical protein [Agromyces sp. LHK192]